MSEIPWENGFVSSVHGKLHDGCLNEEIFRSRAPNLTAFARMAIALKGLRFFFKVSPVGRPCSTVTRGRAISVPEDPPGVITDTPRGIQTLITLQIRAGG